MGTNCEKCEKDDAVVIIETGINYRKYKCLTCKKEWIIVPDNEERKEFQ